MRKSVALGLTLLGLGACGRSPLEVTFPDLPDMAMGAKADGAPQKKPFPWNLFRRAVDVAAQARAGCEGAFRKKRPEPKPGGGFETKVTHNEPPGTSQAYHKVEEVCNCNPGEGEMTTCIYRETRTPMEQGDPAPGPVQVSGREVTGGQRMEGGKIVMIPTGGFEAQDEGGAQARELRLLFNAAMEGCELNEDGNRQVTESEHCDPFGQAAGGAVEAIRQMAQ